MSLFRLRTARRRGEKPLMSGERMPAGVARIVPFLRVFGGPVQPESPIR